jgi:hypothetical protein
MLLSEQLTSPLRSSLLVVQVFKGQDAWRQHPVFLNLARQAFPGFKYGALAFGVFVVVEAAVDVITRPKAVPHVYPKKATGGSRVCVWGGGVLECLLWWAS